MLSLLKAIKADITDELARANEKYPMFNSRHEGLSVLQEEEYEAQAEATFITGRMVDYQKGVYTDAEADDLKQMLRYIQRSAIYAAAEYVQLAAMCEKNISYLEAEK